MEFKKLELDEKRGPISRIIRSPQTKRTLIFALIGSVGGFIYFYFTEGRTMDIMSSQDIIRSVLIGGFLGIFVTNSPCARGRC